MITFTDKELSDVEQPEPDLLKVLTTERRLLGSNQTCGDKACHPERELWIWLAGRRDPERSEG
jgi:hypothetical protein